MITKAHNQVTDPVNAAEKKAPMPPPIGGEAAKKPRSRLRDLPGGTMIVMLATAFGMKMPAAIPVSARIVMKASYCLTKPLMNENNENSKQPTKASR